jgi:pimeloyl-ACP methyl ester carboxylesterase
MSQSVALGELREVRLSNGVVRYRECGSGEPVVFVHGLLVNGDLWRKVVPVVARTHRCITPDLPLGSHEVAFAPDADLSVQGLARIITDFLAALDLRGTTIVANDTGGALTQVAVTESPERIGRLLLTSCDAYDVFPPVLFRPLQYLALVPPLLYALVQPLRLRALQRLPIAFGWAAKRPIEPAIQDGYLRPFFSNADVRRDCIKALQDMSPRHTLRAAERLHEFTGPVLIAWAAEDRFFPQEYGRRLAGAFPNAQLEIIPDSYTFIPEDQPRRLADVIVRFLESSQLAGVATAATASGRDSSEQPPAG